MKITGKKVLLSLIAMISFSSYSQELEQQDVKKYNSRSTDMVSLGFGAGMDYGGIGANVLVYPQKNIGLFTGLGYNFNNIGLNVGAKLRLISGVKFHKASPYLLGMYGYNAVINVQNASQYNKTFYGSTFGLGFDFKSSPTSTGYWNFALLVPIRSAEVNHYIADLKYNHGVAFKTGLTPVGFSIGYRAILN